MIAIIDTGGANLASVTNALDRLQQKWQITIESEVIDAASHVILPGVGSASEAMRRIKLARLEPVISALKVPTLGICLGMQLFYESSFEGGVHCLGILEGKVERMQAGPGISIPHMGWNEVVYQKKSPLFNDIPSSSYFYFVHSYKAAMGSAVVALTHHGEVLPAAVQKDNFYGTQFHPERSGAIGAKLISNFLGLS